MLINPNYSTLIFYFKIETILQDLNNQKNLVLIFLSLLPFTLLVHLIQCQPESVVNENIIRVTETVLIASATATTVGPTDKCRYSVALHRNILSCLFCV